MRALETKLISPKQREPGLFRVPRPCSSVLWRDRVGALIFGQLRVILRLPHPSRTLRTVGVLELRQLSIPVEQRLTLALKQFKMLPGLLDIRHFEVINR